MEGRALKAEIVSCVLIPTSLANTAFHILFPGIPIHAQEILMQLNIPLGNIHFDNEQFGI